VETIEAPVLLVEFAARVGSPDHAVTLLDRAGVRLIEDPLGRLTLPAAAARKILAALDREERRRLELMAEHRTWATDRAGRRQQVIHTAYQAGLGKGLAKERDIGEKINSGEILST
jgi:hypothetical protein